MASDISAAPGPRQLQVGSPKRASRAAACCGALPDEVRRLDVLPLPLRGRGPAAALATPALPGRAQQRAGAKRLGKRLRPRARFIRDGSQARLLLFDVMHLTFEIPESFKYQARRDRLT